MKTVERKQISTLPNIGEKVDFSEYPVMTGEDYLKRLNRAFELLPAEATHLFVYGDREHFSNIEFLTGYDPRFEEAVFICERGSVPTLIVGDEGWCYAGKIPYEINIEICPVMGLPGQPLMTDNRISDILKKVIKTSDAVVGVAGWKCFNNCNYKDPSKILDIPMFILEELLEVVSKENLFNATSIFINVDNGLRVVLDAKDLVIGEITGTESSRKTYDVMKALAEGQTELEASQNLNIDGLPLITHPNINFGENVFFALSSPTAHTKLKKGDVVGVGMAYRYSLCHKASLYVDGPEDLTPEQEELYDRYFKSITAWYEALKIGAKTGDIYDVAEKAIGGFESAGVGLNPGHLIHTDEWTHTPFIKGSNSTIKSGMMIQCDYMSTLKDKNFGAHAEDGIMIADSELREKIKAIAPKSFARILERQKFMREQLNINIDDCVLPTSDIPALLFPYLKNINIVLANSK